MRQWPLVLVAALAACATPEQHSRQQAPAQPQQPPPAVMQLTQVEQERTVDMVVLQQVDARSLEPVLSTLFQGTSSTLRFALDDRRNAVLVYGGREETERVIELVHKLDVAPQQTTTVLRLENVSAPRVQQALQNLGQRVWVATVDDHNLLFRGTDEELAAVQALLKQLDQPSAG